MLITYISSQLPCVTLTREALGQFCCPQNHYRPTISTIVTIIYCILAYLRSSKAPQLVSLPTDANSIPTMTKAEPA